MRKSRPSNAREKKRLHALFQDAVRDAARRDPNPKNDYAQIVGWFMGEADVSEEDFALWRQRGDTEGKR